MKAKISHIYYHNNSHNVTGVELILESGDKIVVGNSSKGIKFYEVILCFIPKLIWRCDNSFLIETMFPDLKNQYIGSPLELIAKEVVSRFKSKNELLFFLENFKVNN